MAAILTVDDSASIRQAIKVALSGEGYEVAEAADGSQGLAKADSAHFDMIITDLNMPGGDGMEALARIRAAERQQGHGAVPVIVLSADGREEVRRLALLNGANRMFTKPIDPVRLLDEVQALGPMRTVWTEAK